MGDGHRMLIDGQGGETPAPPAACAAPSVRPGGGRRDARVLALGLAEASWTCIRDFAAHVPFLTRLISEGASGVTLAAHPLVPEALWATVITGRSVDAHGIVGTVRGDRRRSADDLAVPPVWRLLERAGLSTGTFNLTLTVRPDAVRGFMLSRDARPAIHRDLVHPPSLYAPLRRRFGAWPTATTARTTEEWTSVVPKEVEARTDVLIHLLKTRPWDFALAQLPEVARAQHRFWSDAGDTLRSTYAAADRAIARLVDAVGPDTTVFVFSECGAGPVRHAVQLNAWLEQMGYLRRQERLLSKAALSLARVYRGARRLIPRALDLSRLKMQASAAVRASDVDWARTRAHSPGAGGEILFSVPAHDRRPLSEELRGRLLLLRDPEGRRVVEEVFPRREGLAIVWEDDAYVPVENFGDRGRIFVDWCPESAGRPFTGTHRREGILLACGPGIERADLGQVQTLDLLPTWLELLGVSGPRELEGASFAGRLRSARMREVGA